MVGDLTLRIEEHHHRIVKEIDFPNKFFHSVYKKLDTQFLVIVSGKNKI